MEYFPGARQGVCNFMKLFYIATAQQAHRIKARNKESLFPAPHGQSLDSEKNNVKGNIKKITIKFKFLQRKNVNTPKKKNHQDLESNLACQASVVRVLSTNPLPLLQRRVKQPLIFLYWYCLLTVFHRVLFTEPLRCQ